MADTPCFKRFSPHEDFVLFTSNLHFMHFYTAKSDHAAGAVAGGYIWEKTPNAPKLPLDEYGRGAASCDPPVRH